MHFILVSHGRSADDFSFESNAFTKPPTAAPTPSSAPHSRGPAASEFAFESSAFAPVPTPAPQAATPTTPAPSSGFQLKPEPSKGASVPFEAFPLPPVSATAQPQPPAVAKPKDDDWDLFFTEDKSSGTGKQEGAEKTPVDLMADAFKEMQTKQKV